MKIINNINVTKVAKCYHMLNLTFPTVIINSRSKYFKIDFNGQFYFFTDNRLKIQFVYTFKSINLKIYI